MIQPDKKYKYTWNEFSVHLIAELDRFDRCIQKLEKQAEDTRVEVTILKIKVGLWGFAGSACGFISMWAVQEFIK